MDPPRDVVLAHSPLVGPSSLAPTAEALQRRGFAVYTPCIVGSETAWRDAPAAVAAALPELSGPVVVGHSAAGLLLPSIAARLNAWGVIFLDAHIPPHAGRTPPVDANFRPFIDGLPVEQGRVPKWSQWWGPRWLESLIPDELARETFEADLPRLRPQWWDDAVETPAWAHLRCGYLQTSAVYAAPAADARNRGWPTAVLAGTHLHPFLEPAETALAIAQTITAMAR